MVTSFSSYLVLDRELGNYFREWAIDKCECGITFQRKTMFQGYGLILNSPLIKIKITPKYLSETISKIAVMEGGCP